jgi:2-polyprenyl-6-methoxyphenol hydroxylase-like FAD-dependent oxidoreductase
MPQWDFLDFIAEHARRLPTFTLRLNTEVTDLLTAGDAVVGVRAHAPEGPVDIRADLVIAADGRHSIVRERAGLSVQDFGVPIDVLWLRISRRKDDPAFPLGRVSPGHLVVTIDRGDYWQCAFIIRKGAFAATRDRGIAAFRNEFAAAIPFLADRVDEIRSWETIKLLTVSVDRLKEWARPGLLCIGDCAHAMSPIGGVGINLAIQDAVAAANLLADPLRDGPVDVALLRRLQKRRWLPTVVTQGAQVFIHRHLLEPILAATRPLKVPFVLQLLQRFPYLRRLPARAVGIGLRPEHVHSPQAGKA